MKDAFETLVRDYNLYEDGEFLYKTRFEIYLFSKKYRASPANPNPKINSLL